MADYYPLIARAVAAVKDAPAETRAQVYERARVALMKHLRSASPPLSAEAIEREDAALDEAIARVEAEILSGDPPGGDADAAPPPPEPERAPPPRRPPAPVAASMADESRGASRRWRLMAASGVVALAAVGVAALALTNREDASRYAAQGPQPADEPVPEPGPKLGERVSGEPPAPPPAPAPAPPPSEVEPRPAPPPPPQMQASIPQQPAVAVAQRAILYEQRPEAPNEPTVVSGRTTWRLESIQNDQGQPDTAVKIDLDFPERSMGVEITLRRNSDAALPASHLMEIKFQFRAGGGPVKELASPPTMKKEENERGSPLVGLQVPVMENYFLVGLSNAPADVDRNVAQLQAANWIDLPFRFNDDRIGVIAIEKGVQGADAIQNALARWRG